MGACFMARPQLAGSVAWAIVAYNPLSLEAPGIITEIHRAFQYCTAIMQAGTRLPAHDEPVLHSKTDGFHFISFGYQKGSNTHAGVSLSLKAKVFGYRHTKHIVYPSPPQLRGRAALVRTKTASTDIARLPFYLPPLTKPTPLKVYNGVCHWMAKQIRALPCICIPIL